MADGPENLALEHLRHIRAGMDEMRDDMRDVKRRLTSLEVSMASLRGEVPICTVTLPVNRDGSTASRTGSSGSSIVSN